MALSCDGSVAKFRISVALPGVASQIPYIPEANIRIEDLISLKGAQYPKSVILYAVYFYVRFALLISSKGNRIQSFNWFSI